MDDPIATCDKCGVVPPASVCGGATGDPTSADVTMTSYQDGAGTSGLADFAMAGPSSSSAGDYREVIMDEHELRTPIPELSQGAMSEVIVS